MNTYIVTLITRTEVPVFANSEEEAQQKAEGVAVYAECTEFTYDWQENTPDIYLLNGDDEEMHKGGAEHNEEIYKSEVDY